jgi:hypothetical protein
MQGSYPRYDLDAHPGGLLTIGNPKTAKGEGFGVLTAILHLSPHKVSGRNTCPHASAGCAAACLNTAGRGGIGLDADGLNTIQAARIRRTRYFHRDRAGFLADLVAEITRHERSAIRHGLRAAVRLNGTSDLPWEKFPVARDGMSYPHVFAAFPSITFYDYTKWPLRLRDVQAVPNYGLTYSLSEKRGAEAHAYDYLAAGYGVAVVFDTRKSGDLPQSYPIGERTWEVIDGDKTDLRFTDAPSVIVGLRAKGRAKRDDSGFVRHAA